MTTSLRLICLSVFLFIAGPAFAEEGEEAVPKSLYYNIFEPFRISLSPDSNDGMRFLQIKVSLKSKDPAAIEGAETILPMIQDSLRNLFSNQPYAVLSSTEGRRQLQAEAKASVHSLLTDEIGVDTLDDVYFTQFIMQ